MDNKYYKEVFANKNDIPTELMEKMKYGFVMKYGDEIATGWCSYFNEVTYNSQGLKVIYTSQGVFNTTDIIGFRIMDAILNIGSGGDSDGSFSYHSFIVVKSVPIIFFPKEN